VKLLYFAWVRERVGKADEQIDPPASVTTVGELMAWLAARPSITATSAPML
jgi:molybdopterin synthase sulfur carrier subunit